MPIIANATLLLTILKFRENQKFGLAVIMLNILLENCEHNHK